MDRMCAYIAAARYEWDMIGSTTVAIPVLRLLVLLRDVLKESFEQAFHTS